MAFSKGSIPLLLLILSGSAAGQSQPELAAPPEAVSSPWLLTVEERLSRRFDSAALEERSTVSATEPFGVRIERTGAAGRDIVVGRRNPELLLPFEVFRHLISTAFGPEPTTREIFRAIYEKKARTLGLEAMTWPTLERESKPYIESLEKARALATGLQGASERERQRILASIDLVQQPQCGLRLEALNASRQALGGEAFDRFLYQVVAPEMSLQSDGPVDPARLRYIQGGCR